MQLVASRQPVHFVMALDDTRVLLERKGQLMLDESEAAARKLTLFIDRPGHGVGGGFELSDAALGDAQWVACERESSTLKITMRGGHPIFTLRTANLGCREDPDLRRQLGGRPFSDRRPTTTEAANVSGAPFNLKT